jgi:hypothetical protein
LYGTHEISLHTAKEMFGRVEGFWLAWTPICFGPGRAGTIYKALDDHAIIAMYKAFLKSSSTLHCLQADPITHIRVDYKGNSGTRQATLGKFKERSQTWKLDGVLHFTSQPGLVYEHVKFHNYLRQRMISRNSVWEQSADAWELVSYAVQKDCQLAK